MRKLNGGYHSSLGLVGTFPPSLGRFGRVSLGTLARKTGGGPKFSAEKRGCELEYSKSTLYETAYCYVRGGVRKLSKIFTVIQSNDWV